MWMRRVRGRGIQILTSLFILALCLDAEGVVLHSNVLELIFGFTLVQLAYVSFEHFTISFSPSRSSQMTRIRAHLG
jgi:hypothetical protein